MGLLDHTRPGRNDLHSDLYHARDPSPQPYTVWAIRFGTVPAAVIGALLLEALSRLPVRSH
jgi:hypothetical protein